MNSVIIKPSFEPPSQSEFSSESSTPPRDTRAELIRGFRMHRKLAISVATGVCGMLLLFGLGRRAYYETSSLIYVQPMKIGLVTDAAGGAYDATRYDTYIQQQLQTIVRSDILSEALNTPGGGLWRIPGEKEQSAIARLQHNLKIERVSGSYQLSVSLSGNDPAVIAKVVNAVTEAYIHRERQDELAQTDQQFQVLKEERQRILNDLETSRRNQAELSSNLGVADTAGDNGNPFDVQLAELRTQLAAARAAHAVAEAELSSVTGRAAESSGALNAAAEEKFAGDSGLSALKQTISQRRSLLTTQMAGLTPRNPLYVQDQEELKRLDQSLDHMTSELRDKAAQQVQGKLKLEAIRTADIEARLAAQLSQQTALATGATPKLQNAAMLAADITRLQARFTEVDNAMAAIELVHNSSGLVHLLLPADPPLKPVTSKKNIILASALPLGIGFGLFAIFLANKLDPKIYIASDMEQTLKFPPMAVLPNSDDVDSKVIDEFMLRLVAGVDQAHSSGGARTYLFTAISQKTDITELVASLAIKMDRLGYRTMILKASAALQNLALANEEMPKPWGGETRLAKPSETRLTHLRRESFVVENLERLKQNVDLLFIEALPILSSAEAEFAARLADVTVIVAESAQTTRKELTSSLALVRRLSVPGVAAVLNDVSLQNADDEFVAAVQSVQGRQSDVRPREDTSTLRGHDKYSTSIYENPDLAPRDHQTPAQL